VCVCVYICIYIYIYDPGKLVSVCGIKMNTLLVHVVSSAVIFRLLINVLKGIVLQH
jgi:hypothetical protein